MCVWLGGITLDEASITWGRHGGVGTEGRRGSTDGGGGGDVVLVVVVVVVMVVTVITYPKKIVGHMGPGWMGRCVTKHPAATLVHTSVLRRDTTRSSETHPLLRMDARQVSARSRRGQQMSTNGSNKGYRLQ